MNVKTVLKISLPRKTALASALNFRTSDVPRSSSETNTLESPFEVAKKIIIHSNPAFISLEILSSPSENFITEITTIMNISSAFTA